MPLFLSGNPAFVLTLLFIALSTFFSSDASSGMSGQLPSRTQYPPLLIFLHIPNDSAINLKRDSYSFSANNFYSNTTVKKRTPELNLSIDLETWRYSHSLYYGLTDSIAVGIELPFIFFWKGAMDGVVTSIHSAIGQPPKNDTREKDNIYSYTITGNDVSINSRGEKVFGVGDISLTASKRITSVRSRVQAKIIGAVKLPTGKSERLHGSGQTDLGIGVYLHSKIGRTKIYSFSSVIFPGQPEEFTGIKVTPFFTESFTAEYQLTPTLSLSGQVDFNSNPFPKEIDNLGHYTLELVTGIKIFFSGNRVFTLSLTEDLENHTTPDFSINIGFSRMF